MQFNKQHYHDTAALLKTNLAGNVLIHIIIISTVTNILYVLLIICAKLCSRSVGFMLPGRGRHVSQQ